MNDNKDNDEERYFDGSPVTEKEVRELLIEVGLQANEQGLAWFAVDQMFEDARKILRRDEYDRSLHTDNSQSDSEGDRDG